MLMSKHRTHRPWAYGAAAVVVVLIGLGGWAVLRLGKAQPLPPEKLVRVERGDVARSVVAVGRIEPLSKVEVKSKANGILLSLAVDVGDKVIEGQILAELDKEFLQAQVREARATKDAEEANLQVAVAEEARARIEAANPELEFARRDHDRVKALFAENIASVQALDDAEKRHKVSVNRQELLEASVRTAAALAAQARARAAAAQAALERSEENLRYTTIRSPIKGIVLTRDREVGDAVSSILNLGAAATLIMTLGDVSSVYVEGQVDEADVGRIRLGLPVRTRLESFPGETFTGTVTRIAPMGRQRDNVTTFDVRVSIANPQAKLRVNMTANAEIVLEDRKQVLLIPEAALVRDQEGKSFVQVRNGSSRRGYRKAAVKTGISNGQRTEVLEGLEEGTELVLP
jgi:HlyD family secretion protein